MFPCSEIKAIRSPVFSHTVAVLSFGCTPIFPGSARKSRSRQTYTRCSSSFSTPSGVTAPGISPMIAIRSSADAKLSLRVPFFF